MGSEERLLKPLSWNEIRERAAAFARNWEGVASEKSETQSFGDASFSILGKRVRP